MSGVPELAHFLKSTEGNPAVNTIAHAILGGAVAALQGNSAAASAAGAATGELAARAIMAAMYPGKAVSDLSEEQKQTVSTLATISAGGGGGGGGGRKASTAAGGAGGIAGDSTASAAAGAQGGKNAEESNALSPNDFGKGLADSAQSATSWVKYAQDNNLSPGKEPVIK